MTAKILRFLSSPHYESSLTASESVSCAGHVKRTEKYLSLAEKVKCLRAKLNSFT